MINVDYTELLKLISKHIITGRTESAAFLIWYLENFYRLDITEAIDSVCDRPGDKGIDGIYVNVNENTIDVFQARIFQKPKASVGDAALKEFYGTLSQFDDAQTLQNLIDTGGRAQVVDLIKRLDLLSKLESYTVRGCFVTNTEIDVNGLAYLKTNQNIDFIGKNELEETYISDSREPILGKAFSFDISSFSASKYIVDPKTRAIIAPIKATELVNLKGIADQSIFAYNVRGSLGRTKVNNDIVRSIKDSSLHKSFPLFHNGITIICNALNDTENEIQIESYFVVNGCQSLTALYNQRASLSDDLAILTKIIQVDVKSSLSEVITKYSNNQNAIKSKDFKSNDQIQIRIQNEFDQFYGSEYFFDIKRGEHTGTLEIISNDLAGIYMWSFDIKEPWDTHRRYQVFEEKYAKIFGRPEVTADRIVALYIIDKIIEAHIHEINNQLFGKYAITRFAILYMLRLIFETDEVGTAFIKEPKQFVREPENRERFKKCVSRIINDIIVDINSEVDPLGQDFDYRSKLRDEGWVKKLTREVFGNYQKLVKRVRFNSFKQDWEEL